jgi:uncharacterized protein
MSSRIQIIQNQEKLRFETKVNDESGYIDYRWYKGSLALLHIFVPSKGRGTGIPEALAKFALEFAKEQNLKVMVYCSYIAKYIKLHPEYQSLKDQRYHR